MRSSGAKKAGGIAAVLVACAVVSLLLNFGGSQASRILTERRIKDRLAQVVKYAERADHYVLTRTSALDGSGVSILVSKGMRLRTTTFSDGRRQEEIETSEGRFDFDPSVQKVVREEYGRIDTLAGILRSADAGAGDWDEDSIQEEGKNWDVFKKTTLWTNRGGFRSVIFVEPGQTKPQRVLWQRNDDGPWKTIATWTVEYGRKVEPSSFDLKRLGPGHPVSRRALVEREDAKLCKPKLGSVALGSGVHLTLHSVEATRQGSLVLIFSGPTEPDAVSAFRHIEVSDSRGKTWISGEDSFVAPLYSDITRHRTATFFPPPNYAPSFPLKVTIKVWPDGKGHVIERTVTSRGRGPQSFRAFRTVLREGLEGWPIVEDSKEGGAVLAEVTISRTGSKPYGGGPFREDIQKVRSWQREALYHHDWQAVADSTLDYIHRNPALQRMSLWEQYNTLVGAKALAGDKASADRFRILRDQSFAYKTTLWEDLRSGRMPSEHVY